MSENGSMFQNLPLQLTGEQMTIDRLGWAEIKAHNKNGILDGLGQLDQSWRCERDPRCTGKNRLPKLLITYLPVQSGDEAVKPLDPLDPTPARRPQPQNEGVAKRVLVLATQYRGTDRKLTNDERLLKYLTELQWHYLGHILLKPDVVAAAPIPLNPLGLDNRGRFGSLIEPWVIDKFKKVLKQAKRTYKGRSGSNTGPDVFWDELAPFYNELARELGDPFYAELATELASHGGKPAMWDAA